MDGAATYVLRDIRDSDIEDVRALASKEDMELSDDFSQTFVANDASGLAGFCRIRTFGGIAYVNPIVIAQRARGTGLGRRLMEEAVHRHGEVRFVARGKAVPFYESIGCVDLPWQDIVDEVAIDCRECSRAEACQPQPMMLRA